MLSLEILAHPQDLDALGSVCLAKVDGGSAGGKRWLVLAKRTIAFCFSKIQKGAFLIPKRASWESLFPRVRSPP